MIVFDTSTLILLAKVDLLGIFLEGYRGGAAMPVAVKREVMPPGARDDAVLVRRELARGRIRVRKVRSGPKVRRLMADFALGRGEAEALVLALETSARHVATDDRNAMRACRLLGLAPVTAIAVLVRARQKRRLSVEDAEHRLGELGRLGRYAPEVLKQALRDLRRGG